VVAKERASAERGLEMGSSSSSGSSSGLRSTDGPPADSGWGKVALIASVSLLAGLAYYLWKEHEKDREVRKRIY
jgi:hypothetical protein